MPKGHRCTIVKVQCSQCGKDLLYEELTRARKQRARQGKNLVCSKRCLLKALKGPKNCINMFGISSQDREVYQKLWLDKNPERRILHQIKSKASKSGVEFNLTLEDIVIPKVCPVFGVPFDKRYKPRSTSVDRIDNSKGYIKGNIQIISGLANAMKNQATPAELLRFAEWIKKCYGPTKKKRSKQ